MSVGVPTENGLRLGLTPWEGDAVAGSGAPAHFISQVELAERLGFHSFWLPESHFVAQSYPAPLLLLAAAAVRTRHLRLGTTSYLLPVRHPLHVAEEVGVLDQLSGGRVILGVGRGFRRTLFEAFDVPPSEKRDRFEAALEVIVRAWRGEPVIGDPDGESTSGRPPVRLTPPPYQQPHPPIWVAAFGPKALAQAGRLNLPYLASPLEPLARLIENHALHREAIPRDAGDVALPVPVIRTLFVSHGRSGLERVRTALEEQARALSQQATGVLRRAGNAALDEWALVGEPEELIDGIERYREAIGLTHLIARVQVPGATPDELTTSVHLLSELAHRL